MSLPPADSADATPGESWLAGPKPPEEGWSRKKFFSILLLVLAFHVALIALSGTKKTIKPRPVTNVPELALASSANEMVALSDPTLFARPNAHDIVSAYWRRKPEVLQPNFNWTAPSGYLLPTAENFGALFLDFMRHSQPPEFVLDFKPDPKLTQPDVVYNPVPQSTTMQISGDILGRTLLTQPDLPSLARNEIIGATRVRALVDPNGNVVSSVVIKNANLNNADNAADQLGLQIVRDLRFAPAPSLTLGEITFTWHIVPTNTVTAAKP